MIEINYKDDYMKPLLLLTQDKTELLTNSAMMLIKGEVGSGKSRLVMNFMVGFSGVSDNLGFTYVKCPEDKHVIYISTEMSNHHLKRRLDKVLEQCPDEYKDRLKFFNIMDEDDKFKALTTICNTYLPHVIIIDQVADFVTNINDIEQSNILLRKLCNGWEKFDCGIIAIMHQNEDSGRNSKARGHLGSVTEQKVVSSIAISNNSKGFNIQTTKVREGKSIHISSKFNEITEMLISENAKNYYVDILSQLTLPNTKTNICKQIGEIYNLNSLHGQKPKLNQMLEKNILVETKDGKSILIDRPKSN